MTPPAVDKARWLISGRVQGVGFRWWVYRQAIQLGVHGWVRNLPDGRVEAAGVGNPEAIAEFELALARGPLMARVDSLSRQEFPHDVSALKSFDIR